jgi:hypothetical protein
MAERHLARIENKVEAQCGAGDKEDDASYMQKEDFLLEERQTSQCSHHRRQADVGF